MDNTAVAKLQNALRNERLTDYRGIPFWSWNNELEESALLKQIEEMKEAGVGGFIMHARTGLKTEYLGEKWFSCIGACLKKAKELGLNAWVYDENGWPSGFVGGKLLENENYRAQYLEYEVEERFDDKAFCVYKKTENGFVRVYGNEAGVDVYHCVYLCTSPANTDILNPEVVEAFINATHEEYYKRFKDSFGKELVGFFTDEPQYYRRSTPYTKIAETPYKERYGEDIKDGLIYLFVKDERGYVFRERYYTLLNDLYVENFYKRIYEWCEAHGCMLTGHSVDENRLHAQMLGGANVSTTYEYEHIPAIDSLGRLCKNEVSAKQIGSVASQLGKKRVLTETFACCGYDVTPRELASVAEEQYFCGVNMMCQHLFPYSVSAQGRTDHPPVFSKHGNWWEQFKEFNDYFTALGYLVANTKETYDVAVLHPIRSVYLNYVRSEHLDSVQPLVERFEALIKTLGENGVRYQFIDEKILEKYGRAEGDTLVVGKCVYDKIIIPDMPTIAKTSLEILKNYKGKLLLCGKISYVDGAKADVELCSNTTFEELLKSRGVRFTCKKGNAIVTTRSGEFGEYLFVKNQSREESALVRIKGAGENYQALDLTDFTLRNVSDEIALDACGSLILVRSKDAKAETRRETTERITEAFAVSAVTENYLVLDKAAYSTDGKTYSDEQPIYRFYEALLRENYKGDLFVKHTFTVDGKCPVKLVIERNRFRFVRLNGNDLPLSQSDFDVFYMEADCSPFLREGKNELTYCVDYFQHDGVHFALFDPLATESVRNCLYYDTYIEPAYLKGDFVVGKDFVLSKRTAFPAVSSENYKNGYPFFCGVTTIKGKYVYDGKGDRILSLAKGRFLVAELLVNGRRTDMVFDTKKDITALLKEGENEVEVRLRSSLRNLFGPHHYAPCAEPMHVTPYGFTMRGHWENGGAEDFTPEYNCVPFGVDEIEMIKVFKE